jgi:hypothetical protein
MTAENFIKSQLALMAWREAHRYGGIDNMIAVAFVIRNRVKAGWHGGDWLDVMSNHYTFSAEAQAASAQELPDVRETHFRVVLQKIDDLFAGMMVDKMTEEALYYAELHNITREWFTINILRKPEEHPRIAQIGPVTFFR